jgi:hypothetical protein
MRVPTGVHEDDLRVYAKSLYINQHETHDPLEAALILALTKIRPPIELLASQKQAQSSH